MNDNDVSQVDYKTHILIGCSANGNMKVIYCWSHLPRQVEVQQKSMRSKRGLRHSCYARPRRSCLPMAMEPARRSPHPLARPGSCDADGREDKVYARRSLTGRCGESMFDNVRDPPSRNHGATVPSTQFDSHTTDYRRAGIRPGSLLLQRSNEAPGSSRFSAARPLAQ